MRDGIEIRSMAPEDADATHRAASVALYESSEDVARLKDRSRK